MWQHPPCPAPPPRADEPEGQPAAPGMWRHRQAGFGPESLLRSPDSSILGRPRFAISFPAQDARSFRRNDTASGTESMNGAQELARPPRRGGMNARLLLRVTGPVVAISLFLLALGVVAAWYVHRLQKNVSRVVVEDVASVRAAEELEIGIREVQAQLSHFLITGDRSHLKAVPELRRETGEWLDRAEQLAETQTERAVIAQVRRGYDHLFREFDRIAAGRGDGVRQVRQLVDDVINKEILPPAQAYLEENEEAVEQSSRQNEAMAERLA